MQRWFREREGFNRQYEAVVDTRASTTIINKRVVIELDVPFDNQNLESVKLGNGNYIKTLGSIDSVEIKFKYHFKPVLILDNDIDVLLGIDWFIDTGVNLDIRNKILIFYMKKLILLILMTLHYLQLNQMIHQKDLFAFSYDDIMRYTPILEHVIEVTTDRPIRFPPYRRSLLQQQIINDEVEKMLKVCV